LADESHGSSDRVPSNSPSEQKLLEDYQRQQVKEQVFKHVTGTKLA